MYHTTGISVMHEVYAGVLALRGALPARFKAQASPNRFPRSALAPGQARDFFDRAVQRAGFVAL